MIRNYFKTALRNLMKNKGFTFINVFGLALGLTTCLLIVFYVFDELSYDRFNTNADRIFRLNTDIKFNGDVGTYAVTPAPAAAALKAEFPEIEQTVRFRLRGGAQVRKGTQNIQEDYMAYVDPSIFEVFTLPMINGNPSSALAEPHCVVINERIAKKYFNSTDVVGKIMTFNDTAQFKVTGVMRNIPQQSHFNFDFLVSMPTLSESRELSWLSNNFNTYILLKPGADYKKVEARFEAFDKRHVAPELGSILHADIASFEKTGNYIRLNLTPLKDIHLKSNKVGEMNANGNILYVYIFSAVAIFILLIACVNFMNLSTARSANRSREVGVRKVLGSMRGNLIFQFLTESIMVTLLAATVALFLAWALLPVFNNMSGKELIVTPQITAWLIPVMLIIIVVIGCIAGSYPAFYLSAFRPIEVLKGKLTKGFKSGFFRSTLVVFQFSISIVLIISTLVVYNQLQYIQNRDIGYNRGHVLHVQNVWTLGDNAANTFKQEVKQLAGVEDASLSEAVPTWNYSNSTVVFKDKVPDQKRAVSTQFWGADADYIPTLGMKMIAGRNFSPEMRTDSDAMVINESAAKMLNFPNPLNQLVYVPMDSEAKIIKTYHIIGVVKDFNFRSLRENVTPLVFHMSTASSAFSIRFRATNISLLLSQVKNKWRAISPNMQFGYSFMDKDFEAIYNSEQRIGTIAVAFTTLAIIIACLGLFGLAAYAAEQRTKEIGIRKVLGAGVPTIVQMLTKDFVKLVLIAIVIATPVAWWGIQKAFLQNFAYRENVQWWAIALAGAGAVLIAFVTISFQSIKAALMNPVKSLRSE